MRETMTRTAARRLAVQLVFAAAAGTDLSVEDFFQSDYYSALPPEDELFAEAPDEKQRAYITALVEGVAGHVNELDGYIEKYSRGWKLNRISRTALSVLRCALYEILYMDEEDVPDSVAVNEAVELAKGFDEPETVSFINGILGSFLREREMAE
ncbi:MAG: transcription antitermination factor NusB [Oscillospiraceae bacterium]|nr:transcription antitermination factor NusB [Oscillospiraceae bacterium]